jgi:AraC-like DNA-binding protein
LLLIIFPVVLLTGLYFSVYQVITRQMDEYLNLTMDHFYAQSISMMREFDMVSVNVANNPIILSGLDDMDSSEIDDEIMQDEIASCLESNPYVRHVYLVKESDGTIYSDMATYNGQSLSALLQNLGISEASYLSGRENETTELLNENKLAPYAISSIYSMAGDYLGTVIVTMNMTEFLQIFYSLNVDFCAIFNDDVYVSTYLRGIDTTQFDWFSESDISDLIGTDVRSVYLQSDEYNYVIAVAKDDFYKPLTLIWAAFLVYIAIVLIVGMAALLRISRKRFLNMEALANTLPEGNSGFNSVEDVYEGIRNALQDYNKTFVQHAAWKQEKQLREMLTNSMRLYTHAECRNAGLPDERGNVFYMVLFFTKHAIDAQIEIDNIADVRDYVNMLFRTTIDRLAQDRGVSFAFCVEHNIYISVFYGAEEEKEQLHENIKALSDDVITLLTTSYELEVKACISSPVTDPGMLPKEYDELRKMHRFSQQIHAGASTISMEEFSENSAVLLTGDFIRQEQILINTILTRKYDAVPSMTEAILKTHVLKMSPEYNLFEQRMTGITNILVEGVRMSGVPEKEEASFEKQLLEAGSAPELMEAAATVYGKLQSFLEEVSAEENYVDIADKYIQENLSDPNLNVALICEVVGTSPQRLTLLFQERFDMAIAEYVNAQRIELFKKLLVETDLPVNQILVKVGYTNTDTSTRNFKKREGITPSEYRRLHKTR